MFGDYARPESVVHPNVVHEVLEHNHRLLAVTREQTAGDFADDGNKQSTTMVRFDVRQIAGSNTHGESRLDLRAAIKALAAPQHTAEGRVATHVVVQNIWIEAGVNTTDTDVAITCKQHNRVRGNFQRTTTAGMPPDENQHKLFVLHGGVSRSCTPASLVHTASPFCEGRVFRDFHLALSGPPFEQHVSQIAGTQQVEFVAPDLYCVNGVFQGPGNWVLDILRNNLPHSERPFDINFSPITDTDGVDTNKQGVSVRMFKNDWKALRNAITNGIVLPLGEEVIDLAREPYLDFVLTPDVDHLPPLKAGSAIGKLTSELASSKLTREAWQRVNESNPGPWKVAFTALLELNVVKFAPLGA